MPPWSWTTSTPSGWPTRWLIRCAVACSRPPWGHRGRIRDPLYRIRKLLLSAAEQLTQRGQARLRAGLTVGDPTGEVAVAWQGKELLRAVYAASDLADARATLARFYRWAAASGWRSCRALPTPLEPGKRDPRLPHR